MEFIFETLLERRNATFKKFKIKSFFFFKLYISWKPQTYSTRRQAFNTIWISEPGKGGGRE